MSIFEAFILGLVQGLTEFLPVSSSGHTIIAGKLLGIYEVPLAFELLIHLATLLSVVIVMRKKLFNIIKKPFCRETGLIIAASIPTFILAFTLKPFAKAAFGGEYLVFCFLITAALIIISGLISQRQRASLIKKDMTVLDAAIVGMAQGLAVFPGISRSGATICTAQILNHERQRAADFSFLISIPVILGAALFEFIGGGGSAIDMGATALLVGFFTAFFSGLVGASVLLKLLSKHSLDGFAVYLTMLSAFLIINNWILHIF